MRMYMFGDSRGVREDGYITVRFAGEQREGRGVE
jgi:hypothetical protein